MDSLRWMSPEQPELSARGFCKCSQPWEGRSWEAQKGAGIHSITLNRGLPGGDLSVPWEILVLGKSHCFCRFWLLAFANLAGLASKVRTKTFRFCERINSKSSKVALAMRLVPLSRFGRFGSVGMVWDGHRNLQCYRLLCVSQRSCGLGVKFRAAWLPIACQSWYNVFPWAVFRFYSISLWSRSWCRSWLRKPVVLQLLCSSGCLQLLPSLFAHPSLSQLPRAGGMMHRSKPQHCIHPGGHGLDGPRSLHLPSRGSPLCRSSVSKLFLETYRTYASSWTPIPQKKWVADPVASAGSNAFPLPTLGGSLVPMMARSTRTAASCRYFCGADSKRQTCCPRPCRIT